MNNLDYDLYVLAELAYKNEHLDLNEEDLYPNNWYSTNDYKAKNEIIASALKEGKLIENTDKYKEYIGKRHI